MKDHTKNRRNVDWAEHDVLVTEVDGLLVHHLKQPGTNINAIKFINTNGILAVTGDFGNWIFCREFHPSAEGFVSDSYWCEKLTIASEQTSHRYDSDKTEERIREELAEYEDLDDDSEDSRLAIKEYLEESLSHIDDEISYTEFAYRQNPDVVECDDVIFEESVHVWLEVVFDGFDEICRRLRKELRE